MERLPVLVLRALHPYGDTRAYSVYTACTHYYMHTYYRVITCAQRGISLADILRSRPNPNIQYGDHEVGPTTQHHRCIHIQGYYMCTTRDLIPALCQHYPPL